MKKSLILVEGIADLVFIKDFIEVHFDYIYNSNEKIKENTTEINSKKGNGNLIKIFVLGSKEALKNENTSKKVTSEINKESYDYTVLILDADESVEASKELADNYVNDLSLSNSFLFPDDENVGDLETILENIQVDQNIADCWSNFENCIHGKDVAYTIPAKKSKIHTYLEILNPNTNAGKQNCKERNRNYKDTQIWSINDLTNPYNEKLKTFLDQYLP